MSDEKWISGYTVIEEDNTHGFNIPSESGGGSGGFKGVITIDFGDASEYGVHEQVGSSYSYNDIVDLYNNGYFIRLKHTVDIDNDGIITKGCTYNTVYTWCVTGDEIAGTLKYFVNDVYVADSPDAPLVFNND